MVIGAENKAGDLQVWQGTLQGYRPPELQLPADLHNITKLSQDQFRTIQFSVQQEDTEVIRIHPLL